MPQALMAMHAERALIQRARAAGLLDRLRVKLGLPLEFYLLAVHPLIEACAMHVQALCGPHDCNDVQADRLFMEGLELAVIALDLRRGRILPPDTAPEDIGERAHRWTYAVLVAALLRVWTTCPQSRPGDLLSRQAATNPLSHEVAAERLLLPANPLLMFRQSTPAPVQTWLAVDNALLGELHACLLGEQIGGGGTISRLIAQAVAECTRMRGASANTSVPLPLGAVLPPDQDGSDIKVVEKAHVTPAGRVVDEDGAARRFMAWLGSGIRDGSLCVNEARAPVHFVAEGMLLVSPRIFKDYARLHGEDGNGAALSVPADATWLGKDIQRRVLRAGWHRRAENDSNIHRYDVVLDGRAVSVLSGVLIVNPARFVDPIPAVNPLLLRRVSS